MEDIPPLSPEDFNNVDKAIEEILQKHHAAKQEAEYYEQDFFDSTLEMAQELQKLAARIGFAVPKEFTINDTTSAEVYRTAVEALAHGKDRNANEDVQEVAYLLDRLVSIKYSTTLAGTHEEDVEHRDDTVGIALTSPILSDEQKDKFVQLTNEYLLNDMVSLDIGDDFVEKYEDKQNAKYLNAQIRSQLRKTAKENLKRIVGERDQNSEIGIYLVIDAINSYKKPELKEQIVLSNVEQALGLTLEDKKVIIDELHREMDEAGYNPDL